MNKKVIGIVAVLVVITVGVGGFLLHSKKAEPAATAPVNSTSTAETASAANKIAITNFSYSPTILTIKKGTTITWTNQDSTAHTVTVTGSDTGPTSKTLNQGDSYGYTFATVGTFNYHCTFHSNMTGTVNVTE